VRAQGHAIDRLNQKETGKEYVIKLTGWGARASGRRSGLLSSVQHDGY
jgi:hypothetical protein